MRRSSRSSSAPFILAALLTLLWITRRVLAFVLGLLLALAQGLALAVATGGFAGLIASHGELDPAPTGLVAGRFRDHAARDPFDQEVIDYAPVVERRLAECVDQAEARLALAATGAERAAIRREMVQILTEIGAEADARLGPARERADRHWRALKTHVQARGERTRPA